MKIKNNRACCGVAAVLSVVALAACGSDAKTTGPGSTTTVASATTTTAASSTGPSAEPDCSNAADVAHSVLSATGNKTTISTDSACVVNVVTELEANADNISIAVTLCGTVSGELDSSRAGAS